VPSTLALGTSELSEGVIFLKYPVVFPKRLNMQVQTLLPVNKIQETKSFEPSAAPVDVRVNRRLSKSESGLSYVRRKRRQSKPWRLIHCADRRMPSAVKVRTLLIGRLYPHLPRNLLPLNRFSRWMVIPWGSIVKVNFFGSKYSFCLFLMRATSKSKLMPKSTSSAKRDSCCVSVVIDKYSRY
jgi:hypothetical protein